VTFLIDINAGELAGKNIIHGMITPPDRFRSELRLPLAGGTAGVVGRGDNSAEAENRRCDETYPVHSQLQTGQQA